jgi:phosphomannomutase
MNAHVVRAREWIAGDPDPATAAELAALIESGDHGELASRMETTLTFGTAGIRGEVGAGPGRMNRAVVIRTTYGLATYLRAHSLDHLPVVVGFDARPSSRQFAEDTVGVLAAAGIDVRYFPEITPTPLVAFAAKHLSAGSAVVVTASHNPPADNGYKVYGADAAQIVPPADTEIQAAIEDAPPAKEIDRLDDVFSVGAGNVARVPDDVVDDYWDEVSSSRSRSTGSDLAVVYTPIHGCGRDTLFEVMRRAGHTGLTAVPEQAEPDGTFPTVEFPNPEEPGAIDLAVDLAVETDADLVLANDPDADRLAAVIPHAGEWRPLSGNEIGVLLGDYVLGSDPDPVNAIVASSIVSSPMLGLIADRYGATHERTLTGFKWIVKAGLSLQEEGRGRFVYGYEEALGFTIGSTVRDKDGISAALIFTDLAADLADNVLGLMDRLHELWGRHGLWVSAQTSIVREGPEGTEEMRAAVERLATDPPGVVGGFQVTALADYRHGAEERPPWLGAQALVELTLGDSGRILVRPSGTEPKLKVYVDLMEPVAGDPDAQYRRLRTQAAALGTSLGGSLQL